MGTYPFAFALALALAISFAIVLFLGASALHVTLAATDPAALA
jgi:hypothetical protein